MSTSTEIFIQKNTREKFTTILTPSQENVPGYYCRQRESRSIKVINPAVERLGRGPTAGGWRTPYEFQVGLTRYESRAGLAEPGIGLARWQQLDKSREHDFLALRQLYC